MLAEHVKYLACPACKGAMSVSEVQSIAGKSIETGSLGCNCCLGTYPIIRHIPRFVPVDNYANSFGFEWNRHSRTQYDATIGARMSEIRFFEETKWPRTLAAETILEVGSGSGRFTEQACSTGAFVVSMDYSAAVEANYASNGHRENVLIVQGDLYRMPFRESSFDKVLCIGVLQHTPDVEAAFKALPGYLKPGGAIAIDVYRKYRGVKQLLMTKYWVRPITKKIRPEKLHRLCERYVRTMWPLTKLIHRIPRFGKYLNLMLLIPDYRGEYDITDERLLEWTILDAFDMLSPRYDSPQYIETVRRWFDEAGLTDADIRFGYNGIEGRGRRR